MSSTASQSNSEGTQQVLNLSERGKNLYLEGKSSNDIKKVQLALNIFKRGVRFPESATVSLEAKAKVYKNYLSAINLSQKLQISRGIECFDVPLFFAELPDIQAAYQKVSNLALYLPQNTYPAKWRAAISNTYHEIFSVALQSIAVHDFSSNDNFILRTEKRIECLEKLCNMENEFASYAIRANIRFYLCQVLLNASVLADKEDNFRKSTAFIQKSEANLSYVSHYAMHASIDEFTPAELSSEDNFEDFKNQVRYQKCSSESALRMVSGYKILWSVIAEGVEDEDKTILAVDAFKEAQVLARETSLLKEAEATAKLAFIFRTIPSVKDKQKSDVYYQHAFSVTEADAFSSARLTEWGRDVVTERERIQRERATEADARRAPILEKNKDLLEGLRKKLVTSCSAKSDIQEALVYLYESYPPEHEKDLSEKGSKLDKLKKKFENGDHAGGLKLALKDFHPDKNHEDNVGLERHVMCEEITKMVNAMYARCVKQL